MKKTLAFAVATVVAGLSAVSNVPAASAQVEVNLVIPLVREPVVHRTYYREVYRHPYYYSNRYRQGRVYRYDRDDRYERGRGHGDRRYGDSYKHHDDRYRH